MVRFQPSNEHIIRAIFNSSCNGMDYCRTCGELTVPINPDDPNGRRLCLSCFERELEGDLNFLDECYESNYGPPDNEDRSIPTDPADGHKLTGAEIFALRKLEHAECEVANYKDKVARMAKDIEEKSGIIEDQRKHIQELLTNLRDVRMKGELSDDNAVEAIRDKEELEAKLHDALMALDNMRRSRSIR